MKLYWEANVSPIPFPKHSENNKPTTFQNIAVYALYLNFTKENALQNTTYWTETTQKTNYFYITFLSKG